MEINKLYRSILRYAGLDADNDGFVSTVLDERREPALIDGLRLVLPTQHQLKTANPKEKIVFHPLSENILRGESDVLKKLSEVINIRLNFSFGIIGQSLLNIVASPEDHHKLNPDQMELVLAIREVDDTTLKNFISIMVEGFRRHPDRAFSNIYLKRGGSIGEKRYSRVGVVMFPAYEELVKKDSTEVYGVKLRAKDKETFKHLYHFIFPQISTPGSYNRGSDSDVAPYLDALMKTSMALASRFNDILSLYDGFIDEGDKLEFDSDWVEAFEDLSAMVPEIRKIPMQAGNEGTTNLSESEAAKRPLVHPTLPAPPVGATPMAPVAHPPVQAGWPPVMPNAPTRPEVRDTGRGLDFNSLKMANPVMAVAPNPLAPAWMRGGMGMPGMQMERPPTWAAGPVPGMGAPMGYPGMMYPGGGYPNMGYPQQTMMGMPGQMGGGWNSNV